MAALALPILVSAQKKPLDHTVYDSWQSIGERMISNNGNYVVYAVNTQEGDGTLVIQQTADGKKLAEIPRGYNAAITFNSSHVIFKIKPAYKVTREARIQKKKGDDLPKDSLGIFNLATGNLQKWPAVKSFRLPEEGAGWVAWLQEKQPAAASSSHPDSTARLHRLANLADSLTRAADSIRLKLAEAKTQGLKVLSASAKKTGTKKDPIEEGATLVLKELQTGEERTFTLVKDYLFHKKGDVFIVYSSEKNNDTTSQALVLWHNISANKTDTVMKALHDASGFALDEKASQLAFVAERDSSAKAAYKFYNLWHYTPGADSARLLANRSAHAIPENWSISENAKLYFSKSGERLFFGTAPVLPLKDTSLPEFERANVDIWNYKDDALQTVQLFNLNKELKRNFTAVWDNARQRVLQLADTVYRNTMVTGEGDGTTFYVAVDSGKRAAFQWQGYILADVYAIDPATGIKKLIVDNFKGATFPSASGKYLVLYNELKRTYSIYNSETGQLSKLAADIKFPLYDEENDMPEDPNAYGIAGWMEDDRFVLLYDRYDLWKVDPTGQQPSVNITHGQGRTQQLRFRYVSVRDDEKFLKPGQQLLLRFFDEKDKSAGLATLSLQQPYNLNQLWKETMALPALNANIMQARDTAILLYSKESYTQSADLYVRAVNNTAQLRLSAINPQQSQYLWGTASLYKWKAYTGKPTEGIVYKPENFDPKKKYPMIVYFYERNNNTLYNYTAPAPTPSRLNIPFFVSRGYVVFVPDIWYTKGHPGKSAYDYIVSGTRALIKEGFIDSTKIGLQGQSWGGYQTVHLITRSNLYAAAWAGAPVVNMFSAYGGIRWESGLNRQFQYEHSQSRIGATIWEKPDLYTENSPLFHFPKVKTPLVIMANDADGAVPWYQGIECFTALRRLNKPVWMLNYNGEAHNLMERRNRKDIQIREQQFFDWLLKGEKPASWITEGVPALMKGRTWGL